MRGLYGYNESSNLAKTLVLLYPRQKELSQPKYKMEKQDK